MNLSFFDKLKNSTKDEEKDQSFMDDLTEFLKEKFERDDVEIFPRREVSMIQELEADGKLTTEYRDRMLVERSTILGQCARETLEKGEMYFIYSKSSSKESCYNLCRCDEGMNSKVISVNEVDLPEGFGVDSVLRMKNGKYLLDIETTELVLQKLGLMTQKLLEEQMSTLNQKRKDGNKYEIVEISGESAWIMNVTQNDGDCFEEISIPKEILEAVNAGDIIQFVNGEYKVI